MQHRCAALILFSRRCAAVRHTACRVTSKNKNAALAMSQGGVVAGRRKSPARLHLEIGADVNRDLDGIEINKVPDAVMGDTAKFRPVAQRADRRLFARWENTAEAQTDDVRELVVSGSDR